MAMSKNSATIRLGVMGEEAVKNALRDIGKAGQTEFAKLPPAAQASARAFDALERSVDPAAKAVHALARAQTTASQAVAAGVATHQQAARVIDLAAARQQRLIDGLAASTKAAHDHSTATALNRQQLLTLQYTVNDVAASLASGASPFMIMMQQGGQVTQAFGGMRQTFATLGPIAVRALMSPIGAAASLAAGVLAVKAAGDQAADSLAKLAEQSRQTGLSPNRVAGAQIVGARAGLSEDETMAAFANARKEFELYGRNEGAVKASLDRIDKSFLAVADRAKNAGEFIDIIGRKIRELPHAEALDLAKALYTDTGGAKLIDEISRGRVSMEELRKEAEKAGANFDAAAQHADAMRKHIAEVERIASTKLLSAFGALAQPSLAIELAWANIKNSVADAAKAARSMVEAPALERDRARREGAVVGFSMARRAGGRDPFAGKTMEDVDPLINLFTQSDRASRPRPVGEERAAAIAASTKPRARGGASPEERFADVERDLQNRIALAASEGMEHDKIALKIKIENEQRKLGTKATQEQKDAIGELVTQLDAAEAAQKKLTDAGKEYSGAMKEVGDLAKDSLKGFVGDLRAGESLSKSLGNALERLETKLVNKSIDFLVDQSMGYAEKSLKSGSLFGGTRAGGSLSSLFGAGGGFFGGGAMASVGQGGSMLAPFADGGIMTRFGPVPLRRYAGGGIANSPQFAMFGEGSTPEAYVPLPDGKSIPVAMNSAPAAPNITVHNNAPGVSVTPRVMSDGEIMFYIEQRIGANNRDLPGILADRNMRRR